MPRLLRLLVIGALACGSFGIGASQYLVMALLPEIAADIADDQAAETGEVLASTLASGYALGVVVGALIVPRLLARLSDSRTLLICGLSMLVFTFVVAVSPTLILALPMRFLSAMVHATYLGAASVVVSRLLGRDGLGAAIVIGGLTAANLVAVPALTALGAFVSWRAGLLVCAALFLPAVLAALLARRTLDDHAREATVEAASQKLPLPSGLIRLAIALALLAAGVFATLSFIAPLTRELQGGTHTIPMFVTMIAFGVGMNIGNFVSGWQGDRHPLQALWMWAAAGAVGCGVLHLADASGVTTLLGALLIGSGLGGITPPAQVLFMQLLARRRRLAASLAPAMVNLGNFTGTSLAGIGVVAAGVTALPTISLLITVLGIALAVASRRALKPQVVRT